MVRKYRAGGLMALTIEEANRTKASVLYIEDNASNLKLVERILARRDDVEFLAAALGGTGLDYARRFRPALILLDLHLPDMSGDEVLHELRADPQTIQIPVVIVSADATKAQTEKLLAAGANAYLTKPFELSALGNLIDEVLHPAATAPQG